MVVPPEPPSDIIPSRLPSRQSFWVMLKSPSIMIFDASNRERMFSTEANELPALSATWSCVNWTGKLRAVRLSPMSMMLTCAPRSSSCALR